MDRELLPKRFWDKVAIDPESGCWIWTASKCLKGYGQFRWEGRTQRAHRVANQVLVGPNPKGLDSDHLCRRRECVNPDHIEHVPHRVNVMRGNAPPAENVHKTHCPKGHPYAGDNLYNHPKGQRVCMTCMRAAGAKYRAKKREAAR